jgi:protein TonB
MTPERLQYLQVAAPAAAPTPVVPPPPKPEPEQPKPEPVVPPPEPQPAVAPVAEAPLAAPAPSQVNGTGGGSGNDGSAGNGPGSGGGVGSGVGTGRGSGTGPGTGGGAGDIYPPQVTNLALLPIPVPNRVRPYKMVAWFDVDERGNAKLIAFNPSRDSGYNRKIREMLSEVRFRPAVRSDGTPVRDTVSLVAEAPR